MVVALDNSLVAAGEAQGDKFSSIENIYGSIGMADTISGNSGDNVLYGFGGVDTINGKNGIDRIVGGAALDVLTGGGEADFFIYTALSDRGDTILDYSSVDDSFRLRSAAFSSLLIGSIASDQFAAQSTKIAVDANDYFIFRTTDATLWFDRDGSGALLPLLIADLQTGATMTFSDIIIY